MDIPKELRYTKDHNWVKLTGKRIIVGITDFAQSQLDDVMFVEIPAIGTRVEAGEVFAQIESVKTVSALYAPVAGAIVEVNAALADAPEMLNQDPYGAGWITVIEPAEGVKLDHLLNNTAYAAMIGGEG